MTEYGQLPPLDIGPGDVPPQPIDHAGNARRFADAVLLLEQIRVGTVRGTPPATVRTLSEPAARGDLHYGFPLVVPSHVYVAAVSRSTRPGRGEVRVIDVFRIRLDRPKPLVAHNLRLVTNPNYTGPVTEPPPQDVGEEFKAKQAANVNKLFALLRPKSGFSARDMVVLREWTWDL